MNIIRLRQGETLSWACDADADLTGYTITAMLRAEVEDAAPYASLTVTVVSLALGTFTLSALAATTLAWALGGYWVDIRFTSGATVKVSDPYRLVLTQPVTR